MRRASAFTGPFACLGAAIGVALLPVPPAAAAAQVKPALAAKPPVKRPVERPIKRKAAKPPPVVATLAVPEPVRSADASRLIAWIASARDNGKLPYLVIDKHAASLSLFRADGTFVGETPVLLGIGVGDDSSPGIGAKKLADIGPAERTTPAGRFVSKFGRAFGGQRVLWVDYANSVALHAVITTNKKERRVARLLSPTPDDNRISFGCINVGTRFYTRKIGALFGKAGGIVYILPDTTPFDTVFPRVRLLPYLGAADGRSS